MKLTGPQIAAAISLAGMTREALCKEAAIAKSTLIDIVANRGAIREATLDKIRNVLEMHGIEFLPGEGVRKKDRLVETYEGEDANKKLLDDVYKTLRDVTNAEVLIAGVDESKAIGDVDEAFLNAHIERLNKANIKERMLIRRGDTNLTVPEEYYRWIDAEFHNPYPLYIYGPKLALVAWAPARRCTIIHDEAFAESARRLFNFVWQHAEKLNIPVDKKGNK
jgi:transcriptional regulator with XRE-family HTH domain